MGVITNKEVPVDPNLEALIEKARMHEMTDKEMVEQKLSFVAGNLAIDRPDVPREEWDRRVREAAGILTKRS